MTADETLRQIRDEVRLCELCPLHQFRKLAVPGEGPAEAQVMLIGEGPGYNENEQGKPFVGQAGKFLDELLQTAGLNRQQVFITNVVKCRPPGNRDPEPSELQTCRRYLDAQIAAIQPKVIVTLGRFSMARFIENGRISQIHGLSHQVNGQLVVTMYHPAAALHQPDLRGQVLSDFARLKDLLNGPPAPSLTPPNPTPENPGSPAEPDAPYEQLSLF